MVKFLKGTIVFRVFLTGRIKMKAKIVQYILSNIMFLPFVMGFGPMREYEEMDGKDYAASDCELLTLLWGQFVSNEVGHGLNGLHCPRAYSMCKWPAWETVYIRFSRWAVGQERIVLLRIALSIAQEKRRYLAEVESAREELFSGDLDEVEV
jgi:hypothetical protein